MRPTKYRIWDKERKIWKEDYHYHLAPNGQLYYDGMNITEHKEIVFWTGINDRNGKEIYEGDILVDEYGFIHVVQYFQPDCRYITVVIEAFKSGNWDDSHEHEDLVWVECKVIGNIYENPELLKGDSKDA
ncbi:YopX family protein [Paenibacillus sp. MER 180]|uniref:YopX family protein n=1 Tax=Paenibacillus sp. MER 180 TaxID=2939570 RepID=UPI002040A30A|nr:YopX family protein [Paenibacillus sp. MER 180]MCM3294245.1 YopX family protein [Paenibacillus sp. MER 180]